MYSSIERDVASQGSIMEGTYCETGETAGCGGGREGLILLEGGIF